MPCSHDLIVGKNCCGASAPSRAPLATAKQAARATIQREIDMKTAQYNEALALVVKLDNELHTLRERLKRVTP